MKQIAQTNWQKHTRKRGMNSREKQLLTALQDIVAMVVSPNDTRADILAHALKAIGKEK
jgi:ABC-type xylose transport system substrate-binding protein